MFSVIIIMFISDDNMLINCYSSEAYECILCLLVADILHLEQWLLNILVLAQLLSETNSIMKFQVNIKH